MAFWLDELKVLYFGWKSISMQFLCDSLHFQRKCSKWIWLSFGINFKDFVLFVFFNRYYRRGWTGEAPHIIKHTMNWWVLVYIFHLIGHELKRKLFNLKKKNIFSKKLSWFVCKKSPNCLCIASQNSTFVCVYKLNTVVRVFLAVSENWIRKHEKSRLFESDQLITARKWPQFVWTNFIWTAAFPHSIWHKWFQHFFFLATMAAILTLCCRWCRLCFEQRTNAQTNWKFPKNICHFHTDNIVLAFLLLFTFYFENQIRCLVGNSVSCCWWPKTRSFVQIVQLTWLFRFKF